MDLAIGSKGEKFQRNLNRLEVKDLTCLAVRGIMRARKRSLVKKCSLRDKTLEYNESLGFRKEKEEWGAEQTRSFQFLAISS